MSDNTKMSDNFPLICQTNTSIMDKNKRITLRLSDKLHETIVHEAKMSDKSVSSYIVDLLLEYQPVKPIEAPVKLPKDFKEDVDGVFYRCVDGLKRKYK